MGQLYYIPVLFIFTLLTPLLFYACRNRTMNLLVMLITPCLLVLEYCLILSGHDVIGAMKYSLIWTYFYYLGMRMRFNECEVKSKWKLNIRVLLGMALGVYILEIGESILFINLDLGIGTAYSQLRITGFIYASIIILYIYNKMSCGQVTKSNVLVWIGNNSYGLFYIHMLPLIVISQLLNMLPFKLFLGINQTIEAIFAISISSLVIVGIKRITKNKKIQRLLGVN